MTDNTYVQVSQSDPEKGQPAPPAYQPNYSSLVSPLADSYGAIRYYSPPPSQIIVIEEHECIPVGLILFILGWFFVPAWWIGSCVPEEPRTEAQRSWKRVNSVMTYVTLGLIIITILLTVIALMVVTDTPNHQFP